MFIYQLCMSYEGSDGDCAFDFEYVTHENEYSKEEFEKMCKESFNNKYNEKSNFVVKEHLKNKYGFKQLQPIRTFDFEESN